MKTRHQLMTMSQCHAVGPMAFQKSQESPVLPCLRHMQAMGSLSIPQPRLAHEGHAEIICKGGRGWCWDMTAISSISSYNGFLGLWHACLLRPSLAHCLGSILLICTWSCCKCVICFNRRLVRWMHIKVNKQKMFYAFAHCSSPHSPNLLCQVKESCQLYLAPAGGVTHSVLPLVHEPLVGSSLLDESFFCEVFIKRCGWPVLCTHTAHTHTHTPSECNCKKGTRSKLNLGSAWSQYEKMVPHVRCLELLKG